MAKLTKEQLEKAFDEVTKEHRLCRCSKSSKVIMITSTNGICYDCGEWKA